MRNEVRIVHEGTTKKYVEVEHHISFGVILTIIVTAVIIGDAITKLGKSIERCGTKTVEVSL